MNQINVFKNIASLFRKLLDDATVDVRESAVNIVGEYLGQINILHNN